MTSVWHALVGRQHAAADHQILQLFDAALVDLGGRGPDRPASVEVAADHADMILDRQAGEYGITDCATSSSLAVRIQACALAIAWSTSARSRRLGEPALLGEDEVYSTRPTSLPIE